MKEQLSEEARIMCKPCTVARPDGTCENKEIETQNKLAKEGGCPNAKILGLTRWRPKGHVEIYARRRKLESGTWISEIDEST